MTIALFLIPFALIVLLFILGSVVFLYHLLRYGIASFALAITIIAYLLVSAALLTNSFQSLATIDWSEPLRFNATSTGAQSFIVPSF